MIEKQAHRAIPGDIIAFLILSAVLTGLSIMAGLLNIPASVAHPGMQKLYPHPPSFDFFVYSARFLHLHSAEFFTSPGYTWYYPAPAAFFYYPFYAVQRGHVLYYVTVAVLTVTFAYGSAHLLKREGLSWPRSLGVPFCAAALSWPIYFAVQRGNIEAITWAITTLAILLHYSRRSYCSAVVLGCIASVKVYPVLFSLVYLRSRHHRAIPLVALSGLLTTVLALRFLEPNIADSFHHLLSGLHRFTVDYSQTFIGSAAAYDHSLFGLVKGITRHLHANYQHEITIYYIIAGSSALAVYLVRIRKQPDLCQLLFLTCATVVLPPTSYDYTLSVLYVPFIWLAILSIRTGRRFYLPMILLAICLAPETFLSTERVPEIPGLLKALSIIGLMAWACLLFPLQHKPNAVLAADESSDPQPKATWALFQ